MNSSGGQENSKMIFPGGQENSKNEFSWGSGKFIVYALLAVDNGYMVHYCLHSGAFMMFAE